MSPLVSKVLHIFLLQKNSFIQFRFCFSCNFRYTKEGIPKTRVFHLELFHFINDKGFVKLNHATAQPPATTPNLLSLFEFSLAILLNFFNILGPTIWILLSWGFRICMSKGGRESWKLILWNSSPIALKTNQHGLKWVKPVSNDSLVMSVEMGPELFWSWIQVFEPEPMSQTLLSHKTSKCE